MNISQNLENFMVTQNILLATKIKRYHMIDQRIANITMYLDKLNLKGQQPIQHNLVQRKEKVIGLQHINMNEEKFHLKEKRPIIHSIKDMSYKRIGKGIINVIADIILEKVDLKVRVIISM